MTRTEATSTQQTDLVLYDTPGSPCARRVRMTLIEKALPFRRVVLDLARMENKAPWYLRLNPNGQVPTLRIGSRVLYESNVITEYLDRVFPEPRLYPADPEQFAQVKRWQTFEAIVSKHYGLLQYARLLGPLSRIQFSFDDFMEQARQRTREPALLAWEARVWKGEVLTAEQERHYVSTLYARLDRLEGVLRRGRYLVGDRVTQADISVYPRVVMFPYIRLNIPANRYPAVRRWMRRLESRPSFADSRTVVDRIMRHPLAAQLITWADPATPHRHAALAPLKSLTRITLSRDIIAAESAIERHRKPPARSPEQVSAQAPVKPVPSPAGAWTVFGCPFNTETHIVVAALIASGVAFTFHPVLTPLAAEHDQAHRQRAELPEVPLVIAPDGPIQGWPYVLGRIAEHSGPSLSYPQQPWDRAWTQVACMGDTVVNYKYLRPLIWQRLIGPWLRQRWRSEAALLGALRLHTSDADELEWRRRAWRGELLSDADTRACFALLDRRARFVGQRCLDRGWFAAAQFTIGDIAEWTRQQEAIAVGWRSAGTGEQSQRAYLNWCERMAEQPFASTWVQWRTTQQQAPATVQIAATNPTGQATTRPRSP